jgi:hypothetical protein
LSKSLRPSGACDIPSWEVEQVLSSEGHRGALFRIHQSGYGPQRGALPGAIGADDADDFTLVNFKADAVQSLNVAVRDSQVFNREKHQTSTSLPR